MSEMLTDEDVLERYGEIDLTFTSYYKYVFSYIGSAPAGVTIHADYGGDADDIYRHAVGNNDKQKVGLPSESWNRLVIKKGDEIIYEYGGFY